MNHNSYPNVSMSELMRKVDQLSTERSLIGRIATALFGSVLALGGYLVFATVRSQAQIEDVQRNVAVVSEHVDRIEDYLRGKRP